MLYQLSFEATHWERGQLMEFKSSCEEWNDVFIMIWNNSYLNCGCTWKWRMIIAVFAEVTGSNPVEALNFFQASSSQLLKLENLLRWSFFTFIYNRRTNMNYFIYTSNHSRFCLTIFPNSSRLIKITTLRIVMSTLLSVTRNVIKHRLPYLIFYHAETFPKCPSVLRVTDVSDRNPPITAR